MKPWEDRFFQADDDPDELIYQYNQAASVIPWGRGHAARYEVYSDIEWFVFRYRRNPMAFLMAEVMGDNEWVIDDWIMEEE